LRSGYEPVPKQEEDDPLPAIPSSPVDLASEEEIVGSNEIYHKIENMDKGINQDEIVKDWIYDSTFAV
jgi:hypothetical protein